MAAGEDEGFERSPENTPGSQGQLAEIDPEGDGIELPTRGASTIRWLKLVV